ncbi:MAG TPA: hypothetical protein VD765_09965, partial [Solirubrobacterales bacterium]|nr:hypothetical protein [Solirubrobacterales bacterium]
MRVERIEWDGADATACAAQVRALVPGLEKVTREVGEVIVAVGAHGDQAVRDLGVRFGEVQVENVRVDPGLIQAAPSLIAATLREA